MLKNLYETPLKNPKFISRKFNITAPKTLIHGGFGSGKSSLLIDKLKEFKNEETLYINLEDIRIKNDEILANLKPFLVANPQIIALGIDNLNSCEQAKFIDEICELNLQNIIITTELKWLNLPNFTRLNLHYLDYEEFIAFFKKNLDQDMLFSHFLAHGRSAASAFMDASEVGANLQNALKAKLNETNLNILKECAGFVGASLNAFELYKNLKTYTKISKDKVYGGLNELENRGFIALVPRLNEPNSARKVFFNDFALRHALELKKDFARLFSNVVFCELYKFEDEIFFTKELDFFLLKRKIAIICNPFSDSSLIFLRFKKLHPLLKNLGVLRLQVISVANSGEMSIEGIKCEILPFSRWALGF